MKKSLLTHIGMEESSEFSMLMLSTVAQSRHRLISSELISFVRWFDLDVSFHGGWKALWLHCVGFLNAKSPTDCVFSFLDPSIVIRGAHIIPAFAHGQTPELLHPPNLLQGSHSMKM